MQLNYLPNYLKFKCYAYGVKAWCGWLGRWCVS